MTETVDRVLSAGSGHSLMSGVLSMEGSLSEDAENLMPEIREKEEQKMKSRPHGVLAVHIKRVKFRTKHFASFFDPGSSIGVYLHLHVFGKTRATAVYKNVQFPSTIAFDDIKHFSVMPNPKHSDEENKIRLELIGYDRPDVHLIIASRSIHIYDILQAMYLADTYKLVSKENKEVAEVEIEHCFAYGQMGYGASNQLGNNSVRPKDLISHSMFARPAPPLGRQIDEETDVMNCIPLGPPTFIDFPHRSQLSHRHDYAPIATDVQISIEPTLLAQRIRHRMATHQRELEELTTRKQRLRFIRALANPSELNHQYDTDEIQVPNKLRLKEYDGSQLNAFNTVSRPPTAASDYDTGTPANLGELDAILEQAPGLERRRRAQAVYGPTNSDLISTSVSSGSTGEAHRAGWAGRLCDWISHPFTRRRPVVLPVIPAESDVSYEMQSSHSYYSSDLNVLTQDRTDPRLDEIPPEEDPSQELVTRRIIEANNLLWSSEIEEYHGDRRFGESTGDEEGRLRQRTPVPNLV